MSTETAGDMSEPTARVPKTAWRASNHLRRYMPLYVFGTLWALMLGLLPTVTHNGSDNGGQVAAFAPGSASDTGGTAGTPDTAGGAGDTSGVPGTGSSAGAGGAASPT